jgi:diacylglycerol kinase family enzyme
MHVFFYDPILTNQKYATLLAKMETKITDLGLGGKIVRLNLLHNLEKAITDEAKPGQTLIFIGGDQLLNQALPILAKKDVTVGHIPISGKQILASALGIADSISACEILAARRIVKLDLALANNNAFLTELTIKSDHCSIDIGSQITLEITSESRIKLTNLALELSEFESQPDDQLLELTIVTKNKPSVFKKAAESISYFQHSEFLINADNTEAILDLANSVSLPVKVEVVPQAINFIVGKERKF